MKQMVPYDGMSLNHTPQHQHICIRNFVPLYVVNGVKGPTTAQVSNVPGTSRKTIPGSQSPPMRTDGSVDYDALYEEDDDQNDISMENHGSMITHLLSQVKIGMDLTKVVLPTFILETRSLLEMYADYFAHPDMFVSIADKKTPRERMVQVVKWYMSAYHAGRKSSVAKKPYNPILGEVFQCHWDIPGSTDPADDIPVANGPLPWCKRGQLAFIAEQVSHHPPISAFYAECVSKKICFEAFVYTKSKFLGLSVGVHNIGHGTVHVLDFKEDYVVTFPSGYGRSILTTPWIELGGTVSIACKKSGYNATVEFHTKPFYGGKKHRITGEIYGPSERKPFITIAGEWNGVMEAKNADTGKSEVFVDVLKTPVTKKTVQSVFEQSENESRNLWKEVTAGLRLNDIDKATMAKTVLEQKQRDEAKKRKERGTIWETKLFVEKSEGDWCYRKPLMDRLEDLNYTSSGQELC
ncbi:Oxysterol-binding protein- protein 9 [Polyplax serrata]|uniref:Oxysterol-binding protein n=1 Tax=Polyplax serrata TaxID=468196 RepID=A0ABR1AP51_POLSC